MRCQVQEVTFPDCPGVYLVYERRDGDRPLYVGVAATQSLRARWKQNHLRPRAGGSALRRSLGVHLGLVPDKLRRPSRYYPSDVEAAITSFLKRCYIELAPVDSVDIARRLEAETIRRLAPTLNASMSSCRPPRSSLPGDTRQVSDSLESSAACGQGIDAGRASLSNLVRGYVRRVRPRLRRELDYYSSLGSYDEAIRLAASATTSNGNRHSHQRRLSRAALDEAADRLHALDFRGVSSFQDLIESIEAAIGGIRGIGELMVYDTALRLGAFLELEPDAVYLHRGTRVGAAALGLDVRRSSFRVEELPPEIRALAPLEIEDFLCIYKEHLG